MMFAAYASSEKASFCFLWPHSSWNGLCNLLL